MIDRIEIDKAMEESYGIQIYNNWHLAKHFLLLHIKHHISVLGTTTAIFARDEYQACEGNLSHNHLILAIDKSSMNHESEQYIKDLIRTFVMEIVKTETDLPRLLKNGLLKSVKDVKDVTSLANTILVHRCNERCRIRIGPGNIEKILCVEKFILFVETLTQQNIVTYPSIQSIRKLHWMF